MLLEKLKNYEIILASKSPRRQMLLKELNIDFKVITKEVDETYPTSIHREEIPRYLAQLKADAFDKSYYADNTLLITADTVVWINDHILGKPKDEQNAIDIISELSGNKHEVFTAICLRTKNKTHIFHAESDVHFRNLSHDEIKWYVQNYKPFDKAGAYGVQEWIGYIGIQRIEGSYYNVMGLPTQRLYIELGKFLE